MDSQAKAGVGRNEINERNPGEIVTDAPDDPDLQLRRFRVGPGARRAFAAEWRRDQIAAQIG